LKRENEEFFTKIQNLQTKEIFFLLEQILGDFISNFEDFISSENILFCLEKLHSRTQGVNPSSYPLELLWHLYFIKV